MVTTSERSVVARPVDVAAPPGAPPDAAGSPSRRHARRRRPRGRRLAGALVAVALLVAVVALAVGWYVSGEIIAGLRVEPPGPVSHDTDVIAFDGELVTLRQPAEEVLDADRSAVLGLSWDGGYGQLGPAIDADASSADASNAGATIEAGTELRPFTLVDGAPPAVASQVADVDSFAFPTDPARAGLDHEVVTYPGPLGDLQAWHFPGEGSTWLIGMHGLGADRHDLLRFVAATRELDLPTLVIRYRNDPDAPATDGTLILAGQQEWEDVAAAVIYAQARGATEVVLSGVSMGGALALGYALEGDPELVSGLILESPTADLREIVALRSGEALPVGGAVGDAILAIGRWVTTLRTGLDFGRVDYVERADELTMPVLLFHGTADPTVPVEVGRSLAGARPDLVEYHEVPGGEHVRAWNMDPDGYTATVSAFLERIEPSR
jgi:uncharacterized protein